VTLLVKIPIGLARGISGMVASRILYLSN
jgi:hypothetical protein